MDWLTIYTKPRWEKKVLSGLQLKGITCYSPLIKKKRKWSDRIKVVDLPLFPSYVFVQVRPEEQDKALYIPGVLTYVRYMGKPAILRQQEIARIEQFVKEYGELESLAIANLSIGDRVKITEGAFDQKEGEILQIMGKRVLMVLESLGSVLVTQITKDKIRPV